MLEVKQSDLPVWQRDAVEETEFHCCEARRGREFIVRMNTGADPVKAITEFAKQNNIRFGKVHATFMGGFSYAFKNIFFIVNRRGLFFVEC